MVPLVRDLLRRAILTLLAMPGKIGPTFPRNSLAAIALNEWSGYGAEPERIRFRPTPRDVSVYIEVLRWFTWYEHNVDERHAQVFWAWTMDVPIRVIKRKFNVTPQTVHNWLNVLPERVLERFPEEISQLGFDKLDEIDDSPPINCFAGNSGSDSELLRSPPFLREPDAKPLPGADEIEGSIAARDNARTVRKLIKNAHKWAKINRRVGR